MTALTIGPAVLAGLFVAGRFFAAADRAEPDTTSPRHTLLSLRGLVAGGAVFGAVVVALGSALQHLFCPLGLTL